MQENFSFGNADDIVIPSQPSISTKSSDLPVKKKGSSKNLPKAASGPPASTQAYPPVFFGDRDRRALDQISGILIVLKLSGASDDALNHIVRDIEGHPAPDKKTTAGLLQLASSFATDHRIGSVGALTFDVSDIGDLMSMEREKKVRRLGESLVLNEILPTTTVNPLTLNLDTGDIVSVSPNFEFSVKFHPIGGGIDYSQSNLTAMGPIAHPRPPVMAEGVEPRLVLPLLKMVFPADNKLSSVLKTFTNSVKMVVETTRGNVVNAMVGKPVEKKVLDDLPTKDNLQLFYDALGRYPGYDAYILGIQKKNMSNMVSQASRLVKSISDPKTGVSAVTHLRAMRRRDPDATKIQAFGGVSHIAGVIAKQLPPLALVGRLALGKAPILNEGYNGDIKKTPIILVGPGRSNITHVRDILFNRPGYPDVTIVEPKSADLGQKYVPMDFLHDFRKQAGAYGGRPIPGIQGSMVISDAEAEHQVDIAFNSLGGDFSCVTHSGKKSKATGGGATYTSEFCRSSIFMFHALENDCAFFDGKIQLGANSPAYSHVPRYFSKYVIGLRAGDRSHGGEYFVRAYNRSMFPKFSSAFPFVDEETAILEWDSIVTTFLRKSVAISAYRTLSETFATYFPLSLIDELTGENNVVAGSVYFPFTKDGNVTLRCISYPKVESVTLIDSAATPINMLKNAEIEQYTFGEAGKDSSNEDEEDSEDDDADDKWEETNPPPKSEEPLMLTPTLKKTKKHSG